MTTYLETNAALQAADDAWMAELLATFGAAAQTVRYKLAAKGEPGSSLRAAWDARYAALQAWFKACDQEAAAHRLALA